MKLKSIAQNSVFGLTALSSILFSGCNTGLNEELPNILWLTSEDNSPFLGCYGDTFATTPNLDKFASEGFLYTHAYANAPVCAPSRNTIITGVYANSAGNQHMRSYYPLSDQIVPFPEFLQRLGYYCVNNVKTDYNTESINAQELWDESSSSAHYKNRAPGQPFFAVFNTTLSHESSLHDSIPDELLRHRPENVPIPPYHPDTPAARHDWAQYYDKIEEMDSQIGKWLKELEEAGLAENTIVFYFGDHGGALARSKRFVYETGTRVPFIVRLPQKFKHLFPSVRPGSKLDRLISFVDLAPTMLSIVGVEIPVFMQGSAFMGSQKTEDPTYVYMFRDRMDERYDMSRAVRDSKYRYIRNYMPFRKYGQYLEYLWRSPLIRSWELAYTNGDCNKLQEKFWKLKPVEELYDTENDPWETNNLAGNSAYTEILNRLREENRSWTNRIKDTGFIPEIDYPVMDFNTSMYDVMRYGTYDIESIIEAAELATLGEVKNIDVLCGFLKNENSAVRYWGATGLLILKEFAASKGNALKQALNDSSPFVVTVAAEALYNLDERELAIKAFISVLKNPNMFARCLALNAISELDIEDGEVQSEVLKMLERTENENTRQRYDHRLVKFLFYKWGIDSKNFDLNMAG